jgi:SAM-dependent methyltransferase
MSAEEHPVRTRVLRTLRRRLSRLKKTVRPILWTPYHMVRSKLELVSLRSAYERRYGGAIIALIDPSDEMYRFIADHWDWAYHSSRLTDRRYALREYLATGDQNVRELEEVLTQAGRPLSEVGSFLEFASGYGRMTRFLVHRLHPSRITVADINPSAVSFTCETFGVRGFLSVEDPSSLRHDCRYDVIFVGSLFTHLHHAYWGSWLQHLYSLLLDAGLLIFSTHGLKVLDEIYGPRWKALVETESDGFWFLRTNETLGRLPTSYYGAAFVTDSYVRTFVETNRLGRLEGFHPAKFGFQDLYVVNRTSSDVALRSALGAPTEATSGSPQA